MVDHKSYNRKRRNCYRHSAHLSRIIEFQTLQQALLRGRPPPAHHLLPSTPTQLESIPSVDRLLIKLSPRLVGIVPGSVPSLDCLSGEGSFCGFLGVSRPRVRGTSSVSDAEVGVVGVSDDEFERVGGRYGGSVSMIGVFLSKKARIRVGTIEARIYGQTAVTKQRML